MADKTFLWNKRSEELHEDPFFVWRDLITKDLLAIQDRDWRVIVERTANEVQEWKTGEPQLHTLTKKVYELFAPRRLPDPPQQEEEFDPKHFCLLPSFKLSGATIGERALLCSAVAYCLAYDNGYAHNLHELSRLRLSALLLEMTEIAEPSKARAGSHPALRRVHEKTREVATRLYRAAQQLAEMSGVELVKPKEAGDTLETVLYCSDLLASNRLKIEEGQWTPPDPTDPDAIERTLQTIPDRLSFSNHPIINASERIKLAKVALVSGGATKIKGYFLESARLPEIRGASTLLDVINLDYIPALFGRAFSNSQHSEEISGRFGRRTKERLGLEIRLDAPECVIYAAGGSVLAFAPTSVAEEVAQEIENLYTSETLVANSYGVSSRFDLIELQYGINPESYWIPDFFKGCADNAILQLLESYYRHPDPEKMGKPFDQLDESERRDAFLIRKCFGELATKLAMEYYRRREGNEPRPDASSITLHDRERRVESVRPSRRHPPHYEIIPQARRCSSCERRPAILEEPKGSERYLCAACGRKRLVGRRSESRRSDSLYPGAMQRLAESLGLAESLVSNKQGISNWVGKFERYLSSTPSLEATYYLHGHHSNGRVYPAQDLSEIADDRGFVGLVYSDGNNVGWLIERTQTASQYRQLSTRLFDSAQRAVFCALGQSLHPHNRPPSEERPDEFKELACNPDGSLTVHPFEIISIGGDDLFLFVPGERALEVTLLIGRYFEEAFESFRLHKEGEQRARNYLRQDGYRKQHDQPCCIADVQRYKRDRYAEKTSQPAVSLSTGVVIADCHTPVYFMEGLATQLLKSAKRYAKRLKPLGYLGGTVDFMALKSVTSITSDVASFRSQALEREDAGGREKLKLYARPYTLHELEGIIRTTRELRAAPRSQLHALRADLMKSGRQMAILNYLYYRTRNEDLRSLLSKHLESQWLSGQRNWSSPWQLVVFPKRIDGQEKDTEKLDSHTISIYETLLYDILEISDFIPREPAAGLDDAAGSESEARNGD